METISVQYRIADKTGWADYVFANDFISDAVLHEVAQLITTNKRLPGIYLLASHSRKGRCC